MMLTLLLIVAFADQKDYNGEFPDQHGNQIAIATIDAGGTVTTHAYTSDIDIRTDDDGVETGRVWIEYDGTKLKVYLDSDGDTKPSSPTLSVDDNIDLSDLFYGPAVNVGFTAATGSQADFHDVMNWNFRHNCEYY